MSHHMQLSELLKLAHEILHKNTMQVLIVLDN